MSIRKRTWGEGEKQRSAWVADYVDQGGTRRLKTFKTRRDADSWLLRARTEVATGRHLPERQSPTFADTAARWLASAQTRDLERGTLETMRQHVDLHLVPRLGRLKLAKLTEERIAEARDDLLRSLGRALAVKVMVSLRSILRQAGRPSGVRLEARAERHKFRLVAGRDFPTSDQVRDMLAAAHQPAKAVLALAALAGLRASEIRGLDWQDVDLPAGEISIRQRADKFNALGSPKSGDARRTIPIGPQLVAILEELGPGEGLLFSAPRAGGPMSLQTLRKRVIGPVKLHRLRHFYASWQLAQGVPLGVLQRRMGHGTISMLSRYAHLLPVDDAERDRLAQAEAQLFNTKSTV
jgi:integrase